MRPHLSGRALFCFLALFPLVVISTLYCLDVRAEGGVLLSPKWGSVTEVGKPSLSSLAALTTAVPVPVSDASREMLQFKSGSHVLGFHPTKAYLVALDHALSVEFLGTKGVTPTSSGAPSAGKAAPLGKVEYRELWPGVSLSYESTKEGIVESTYQISPGADVSRIRLRYNVPVEKQGDGSLRLTFDRGYVSESPPVAWQDIRGERIPVEVSFKMSGGEIGFKVGDYDPHYPLIIDPTYAWHTFYGSGGSFDFATGIAVDSGGNVYVAGYSDATWGSPLHAHSGGYDIVVLKLSGSGAYQWHTFYGSGGSFDSAYGIAVDSGGNVYVAGYSDATWGSPLLAHSGNIDIFVLKLDSNGAYQWHTFYGSANYEFAYGIAVDSGGNVYVAGRSDATWGSPIHAHSGGLDIVVMKLNSNGAYQWHTFHGSDSSGYATSIAVDSGGNVYVAGTSDATWGLPLHAHSGGYDIVVLKLDSSGYYLWHTFYGSGGTDYVYGISVNSGNVYVAGRSNATWGSPLHAHSGGDDIVVLKLDSSGYYQWHTFYGSGGNDNAYGVSVDSGGNVYIAGGSGTTWGSPLHAHSGGYDIVVLKLSGSGAYQWHTFYGSGDNDNAYGISVDSGGNVYVAGDSVTTWGSPLHAHSGVSDIFVLKLNTTMGADFNSDEKRDILWRNATTGDNYVWFMNGTQFSGSALLFNVPSPWQIVGVGDFNADGKPDILWRNPTTGDNYVWFMNGTQFSGSALLFNVPSPWQLVGVGDFNADGKPDILWRNPTTGDNYVWFMNGTAFAGSSLLFNVPSPWQIVGVGDFNSDGKPDILWRNPTTGDNYVWFMNGTAFAGSALLFNVPSPWQIVGVGDFNSDGKPDILWRNPTTGDNYVWFMNGTTFSGSALLFNVPAPWEIVGH